MPLIQICYFQFSKAKIRRKGFVYFVVAGNNFYKFLKIFTAKRFLIQSRVVPTSDRTRYRFGLILQNFLFFRFNEVMD